MTAFTTISTGSNGKRPDPATDLSRGLLLTSANGGVIYDDSQLLESSQPNDPLGHVASLTVPAAFVVPTDWLGITCHRWPTGGSQKPTIPYSTVRSHDFYVGGNGLRWDHLEKSAGVWDWVLFDKFINQHKADGKDIIITLGFTPSFYAGTVTAHAVGKEAYGTGTSTAPTDMTKWQAYVQAVVDRAITTLGVDPAKLFLECWNEPHFSAGFPTYFYSDTAAKLSEMLRITYRIAKAKSASIKVLCPPVSKIETTGRGELVLILDASAVGITVGGTDGTGTTAADWCDIVSVHTYTESDTKAYDYGSSMFANMAAVRVIRDARTTTGKSIWITESGYLDGNKVRKSARVERVCRLMMASVCCGSSRVILYSWDNNVGMGIADLTGAIAGLSALNAAIVGKTLSYANACRDGRLAVKFTDGSSYIA